MDLTLLEEDLNDLSFCPTKIKVIGVGGGGSKIVDRMISAEWDNIEFITVNTDLQDLKVSCANTKIPIGRNITKGLGSGGVPEVGEKSAIESIEEIKSALEGADMVFITCGMGGGTGTGAAPIVAQVAKELDILSLAIVTTPFDFEGPKKKDLAQAGLEKLKKNVDSYIVIPNENIIQISDPNATVQQAFKLSDDVLLNSVKSVTDIISGTGLMNVDFADIKQVLKNAGNVVLGIGHGKGENKVIDAFSEATNNPLLTTMDLSNADKCILNVTSDINFKMSEFTELLNAVTNSLKKGSDIKTGRVVNSSFKDEILVTFIASGENLQEKKEHTKIDMIKDRSEKIESDICDLNSFNNLLGKDNSVIFDSSEEIDLSTPAYLRMSK